MLNQSSLLRSLLAVLVLVVMVGLIVVVVGKPAGPSLAQDGSTPEPTEEGGGEDMTPPDPNSEDIVERGMYLVRVAAACQDCHYGGGDPNALFTDPLNISLAGGFVFAYEPWGAVAAPNLTALGEWTDEEIESAIRYGVRPDGQPLLPPMPYELYAGMSDEDMAAMIAYLRSLEPEESEIAEPTITEGTGQRADVRSVPEFDPEAEFPTPDFSDPLARGTYLATHVTACLRCHGSQAEDGISVDPKGPAAGTRVVHTEFGSFTLPPLLQSDVGGLGDEELFAVLRDGIKPDGEPVFFMPVYAFHYLTDADTEALIAWIRSQP